MSTKRLREFRFIYFFIILSFLLFQKSYGQEFNLQIRPNVASEKPTQKLMTSENIPIIQDILIKSSMPLEETLKDEIGIATLPLISEEDEHGAIGLLPYEKTEGKGIRFNYSSIENEKIGHFWLFEPKDLRGKLISIAYSGNVPKEITFKLSRSSTSAIAAFHFPLESSSETKSLVFKVPNTLAFKGVAVFKFEIDIQKAGRSYGDFFIERVEVLEKGSQ